MKIFFFFFFSTKLTFVLGKTKIEISEYPKTMLWSVTSIPQSKSGTNPLLKRATPAEDDDSVFSPISKNREKFF